MRWPGAGNNLTAEVALRALSRTAKQPFIWATNAGENAVDIYLKQKQVSLTDGPTTPAQALQTLLDARLTAALAAQVGKVTEVLIEGKSRRDGPDGPSWRGRDPGGRIVNMPLPGLADATGALVFARIRQAKKHSLIGEAEADHD